MTVETLLRDNILTIFNERDAGKRQARIAALWADDGVFIAPNGRFEGHAGVERACAGFIERFPTFTFALTGPATAYHGVGIIPWTCGPAGAPPAIAGNDVLVMRDDKIAAVYVFEDRT